jgi:hypothetical protein
VEGAHRAARPITEADPSIDLAWPVAGRPEDTRRSSGTVPSPVTEAPFGVVSPTARPPDVLAPMICAHVLARSAYSQGARDRQIWAAAQAQTGGTIETMTEADRPIEQRVSVLDRQETDGDSPPEVSASMLPGVEFSSFRLALIADDRRVYIARRGDDDLFVLFHDADGGSGSEGHRSTLATDGAIVTWASVPGDRFIAAGIVADSVTAVRVGAIPAALRDNAFVAVMPLGASDELTVSTPDGERQVPRPPLGL